MTTLRRLLGTCIAASLVAGALAAPARAAPVEIPVDEEMKVSGVEVACTGIGQIRNDPRWQSYGVRVELSNALSEYVIGAAITVRDRNAAVVVEVSCRAPWVLLRLPAGPYAIEGRMLDSTAHTPITPVQAPSRGQARVVLRFQDG